nr:nuclear transcription factor y subunit b-8 [Quercus suber]
MPFCDGVVLLLGLRWQKFRRVRTEEAAMTRAAIRARTPTVATSDPPFPNSIQSLSLSRAHFSLISSASSRVAMAEVPTSPNGGGSYDESGDQSPRANVREQDRFLPIANISRIMKKALPANGKIAKDAKETVQECVSEFISFITSEASDKCQREKRKTINGDDLLWAMATLGFEDYIDPLKIYLARYREGDTKGSAKGGESSAKKDVQPSPNAQIAHQGSFSQGVNYATSQSQAQHLMIPMQGSD